MTFSIQSRQKFCVKNRLGLHATPAAMIVRIIGKYRGIDVWVRRFNEQVNGKSIMGLIMLEARCGAELLFIIEGGSVVEQRSLIRELSDLFEKKFFEE
ncbi:MAG: HPr family phosphocarrier protein [Puniceicoccales bacterium]|jgi:phosphocarrier protein|nr:HPr family phosphocarrier protein [Puniceicoccales bacterium]